MKASIKVRWEFEGFHQYPDAPEEVKFLRDMHRHMFKCTAKVQVFHDDREIEFFLLQRELKNKFNSVFCNELSCEAIARCIASYLREHYPNRGLEVEVSEDGENSSIVESAI